MLKTIGVVLGVIVLAVVSYFLFYAYVLSAFFERGTLEVGEVKRESGLVGKQFITGKPMVYLKNLPHFEDIDLSIIDNAPIRHYKD